jgi:hypothetical protein
MGPAAPILNAAALGELLLDDPPLLPQPATASSANATARTAMATTVNLNRLVLKMPPREIAAERSGLSPL